MIYYLLMLVAIVISFFAQAKVKSAYSKWDKVRNSRGITGAEAARRILDANGLQHIQITAIPGTLTDNFNPRTNTISLSMNVYSGTSIAAIGIAAHEVGHAIQHSVGYLPIKIRTSLVPIVNFGGGISWFFITFGLLLNGYLSSSCGQNDFGYTLASIGVILYATVTLFHLVTLPVELNASSRAKNQIIALFSANENEITGIRKVLGAAAMTYVASLLTSAIQLFRLISLVNSRRR